MRAREMFLLFATASLGAALAGLAIAHEQAEPGMGGHVLIAGMMAVGFFGAAWGEGPSAATGCRHCDGGPVLSTGFCARCGEVTAGASR